VRSARVHCRLSGRRNPHRHAGHGARVAIQGGEFALLRDFSRQGGVEQQVLRLTAADRSTSAATTSQGGDSGLARDKTN